MNKTLLALALVSISLAAHAQTAVKIGYAGPLTGPISHIGKDGENGARLAIEDANARNMNIGGKAVTFELVSEDDQADPRTATTAAQRLTDPASPAWSVTPPRAPPSPLRACMNRPACRSSPRPRPAPS